MGSTIIFVSTTGRMEHLIYERGYPLFKIDIAPFTASFGSMLKFIFSFPSYLWEAIKLIGGVDAEVVVGTGGYLTVPFILAAWLMRRPTLIHSQNYLPGWATRFLAFFATEVHLSFPGSKKYLFWRIRRKFVTGNPVLVKRPYNTKPELLNNFGLHENFFTIFVTGGSQGAVSLNKVVLRLISSPMLPSACQFIWQTGEAHYEEIEKRRDDFAYPAYVTPFFKDMNEAYFMSDVVICRAGALTLSEVIAWGLPSIVIPYPYAGGHQLKNARYLERQGACVVIEEVQLTAELLAMEITKIFLNEAKRTSMLNAARSLSRETAVEVLVDRIVELALKRR